MRKIGFLCIVLLTLIFSSMGFATAATTDELTTLAAYAPRGTSLFAVIRTDNAFIASFDDLYARAAAAFPDAFPPTTRLEADDFTPAGSFDEAVDPWIGDSAAFFIAQAGGTLFTSPNNAQIVVISVRNHAAAEDFLDLIYADLLVSGEFEKVENPNDTIGYSAVADLNLYLAPPSAILTDDAMIFPTSPFGAFEEIVMPGEDAVSLSETHIFQEAVDALPAEDYSALIYTDLGDLVEAAVPLLNIYLPEIDFSALPENIGQQAIGFTLFEENTLALDFVSVTQTEADSIAVVDPAFLEQVPADAAFTLLGSHLGSTTQRSLDILTLFSDIFAEQGVTLNISPILPNARLADAVTYAETAWENLIGEPLADTLSRSNGTFAAYLNFATLEREGRGGIAAQPGFLLQTDDPGHSETFLNALAALMTENFPATNYESGTLNIPGDAIYTDGSGAPVFTNGQISATDTLLLAGTADNVAFSCDPGENTLVGSSAFETEQRFFLPDAETIWLVNVPALRDIAAMLDPNAPLDFDLSDLNGLLGFIDSAAVSGGHAPGGIFRLRFTLTLAG